MNKPPNNGWAQCGPSNLLHYSGAKVSRRGKQPWFATKVSGDVHTGHPSAEDAMQWIEKNDESFWSYGSWSSGGRIAGIDFTTGSINKDAEDCCVMCSVEGGAFPAHLRGTFQIHFLSRAVCARCDGSASEIILRPVERNYPSGKRSTTTGIVCRCGHPVWRMNQNDSFAAEQVLMRTEYAFLRRKRLRESGGRHTVDEILKVSSTQQNRCIYCNQAFSENNPFTKDHLIPVIFGGTDEIMNIVLACRRCNSRRSTIPFRTFCRTLSPTQNRRILSHLQRRLSLISCEVEQQTERVGQAAKFLVGISIHKPHHPGYREILATSAVARSNAANNPLLPTRLPKMKSGIPR